MDVSPEGSNNQWVGGFKPTKDGILIEPRLFTNDALSFVINGHAITKKQMGLIFGSKDVHGYHIEAYADPAGCRRYMRRDAEYFDARHDSIDIDTPFSQVKAAADNGITIDSAKAVDNGITVSAPKVYDSYVLQSRMMVAAQQLATISPWNSAAIIGAYGSFQGQTRDSSYFAAQALAAPAPSVETISKSGPTPLAPQTSTSTVQCPSGYSASIDSSGTFTCVAQSGPTAGSQAAGNPLLVPALISQQVTQPTTQTTVTRAALNATLPPVPASAPFVGPSNVSVSSPDLLVEQVQLNAQLQMYQMLWLGSQSDQFLVRNARALASRAQTTIGFEVSLSPPRQYKHAVAEVRVIIVSHPDPLRHVEPEDVKISLVNLLPSQKTYNVAKITSHQDAFGASAVVDQIVNLGVSTGRAKDRLYIVKDTDTVALRYPEVTASPVGVPLPLALLEDAEAVTKMQRLNECDNSPLKDEIHDASSASIMFGWQFRPVLGADYVTAGPREVFAQMALPTGLDEAGFAPAVYVQTRWREYDEKRQVVGPVYRASCSLAKVQDAIAINSPLHVHDVSWEDVGNGRVKVRAQGTFFSSGMSILTGSSTIAPSTFDGSTIQFFAQAHDLLTNGEIELVGENNKITPLEIEWRQRNDQGCGINSAQLAVVPHPDGSSQAELQLKFGSSYMPEYDGPVHPLVLIGSDVYGLREKPFQDYSCSDKSNPPVNCTYHFTAPTEALRTAQTFTVRDLAWHGFSKSSQITFFPSFSRLTFIKKGEPKFFLSGSDFSSLSSCGSSSLSAYIDGEPYPIRIGGCPGPSAGLTANMDIIADDTALLTLPKAPAEKTVKIATGGGGKVAWDLEVPNAPIQSAEITSDPPFLYKGDSETVTFSGADFSNVTDVRFDGETEIKHPKHDANTLQIIVPSSITRDPGRKEFVAITNKGRIVLKLDVFAR